MHLIIHATASADMNEFSRKLSCFGKKCRPYLSEDKRKSSECSHRFLLGKLVQNDQNVIQLVLTCVKLSMETSEQCLKLVES